MGPAHMAGTTAAAKAETTRSPSWPLSGRHEGPGPTGAVLIAMRIVRAMVADYIPAGPSRGER